VAGFACGQAKSRHDETEASDVTTVLDSASRAPSLPSQLGSAEACRPASHVRIEVGRVGPLVAGASLDHVREICTPLKEGYEAEPIANDQEWVMLVALGGDTVRVRSDSQVVAIIEVRSPTIATKDSLRVSVPLNFLARFTGARAVAIHGTLVGSVASLCGVSFVSESPASLQTGVLLDSGQVAALPSTIKIQLIQVARCYR
jgi:hypothetical protein